MSEVMVRSLGRVHVGLTLFLVRLCQREIVCGDAKLVVSTLKGRRLCLSGMYCCLEMITGHW